MTLQELPEIRRKTEAIAKLLQEQLRQHLETLRPVLAPERVFGKHAGGKTEVAGAERALLDLQQAYRDYSAKPYDLPVEFDAHWLTLVGAKLELHPWEYPHEVRSGAETKSVTMTSPLRWILTYGSNYTVGQARLVLQGKEQRHPEYLRQFVVNALVLQSVISRFPGLTQLFSDLRYELKAEASAQFGRLPLVTLSSCVTSSRPEDDLILAATAFSGVPAFIELVELQEIRNPRDKLRERLEAAVK